MIKTLVVTLGQLGESLIDATRRIIGRADHVSYLTVGWNDNLADVRKQLAEHIKNLNEGNGVLLLTDVFGSTATNVSLEHAKAGSVEVVTGVNLPMIIKASTFSENVSLEDATHILRNQGAKAISYRWLYDRENAGNNK